MRKAVVLLAIILGSATVIAVSSVIAIAVPNLTGLTVPQLELMWKMSVAFGGATGVVLGWIVTHQSALEQQKHKATLEAAQKIVDRAAAIDDATLDTVVKGRVELEIQRRLIEHQAESNRKLEEYKKELDLRYQRKVLELTNEVADRRARQAAKAPVLTALQQAIKDVQASFKALTQIGTNLSPDEIRRRIESAMTAKARLDKDRAALQAVYVIVPDAFEKMMKRFDRLVYDIIAEVRAVPESDSSDGSDERLESDFRKTAKRMKTLAAHLRTITNYSVIAIEREIDPATFYEVRVVQERNLHARSLVRISHRRSNGERRAVAGKVELGTSDIVLLPAA